jgi:hypothetical protein
LEKETLKAESSEREDCDGLSHSADAFVPGNDSVSLSRHPLNNGHGEKYVSRAGKKHSSPQTGRGYSDKQARVGSGGISIVHLDFFCPVGA